MDETMDDNGARSTEVQDIHSILEEDSPQKLVVVCKLEAMKTERVKSNQPVLVLLRPSYVVCALELLADQRVLRQNRNRRLHRFIQLLGLLQAAPKHVCAKEHLMRETPNEAAQRPRLVASAREPKLTIAAVQGGVYVQVPVARHQRLDAREVLGIKAQAEMSQHQAQVWELCQDLVQGLMVVLGSLAVSHPEV
eukprot:CAMPEP_0195165534 /NCGR_PEP_ID=MMETSP0448-20130528/189210_1 /TAXON_ID=66468 /ORGANISM="Heterocapsa triquestra, Strain CCMP 448" /LENGTH=193 /DNA_ID=CAMNT_0040204327 /DNA_START=128 /DNA_END=710 /DNA_ORIENTATION=-